MALNRLQLVCLLGLLLATAAGAVPPALPQPPVKASSVHSPEFPVENLLDGDLRTRWASLIGPNRPDWIAIDFGQSIALNELVVVWERAMATEYDIQVSQDGKTWQTVATRNDPDGKRYSVGPDSFTDQIEGLNATGRYLRLLCRKTGRHSLYSIWELQFPQEEVASLVRQRMADYMAQRDTAIRAQRDQARSYLHEIGMGRIVFAAREDGVDGHWYANFGYYAPDANRKCYRASGRLCLLDTATDTLMVLVDDPEGSVRDPAVHYDGEQIVFSWRKSGTEHFHLYEIRADGTGLRQLTDGGGDYDDIEPCYLPDGSIAFVSSRCQRWVNCWLTQVGVVYRCDEDGGNVRRLSANIEHDNTPWPLPDGRLIYQRWEYIDRSQVHYHHLWTMNPDGTGQMVYFGNFHPGGVFIDAKPVPDSAEVVFVLSPGHGQREHSGSIALLSVADGPDDLSQIHRLTGNDFRDPYPVSKDWFLAARGRSLYLVGRNGELANVYDLPADLPKANLQEPRPLAARHRERIIPPRTQAGETTGTLLLNNLYQGRNLAGVEPGEVKSLLVLEALPKPINFTGGMEPLSFGGTFTLERIVGTVPVEADGSAHFTLPANRALFFVALDEQGRSVKRMQSFLTVQPGEVTGCVGCHESRTRTPANLARPGRSLAAAKPPVAPVPVEGVPEVIDFPRDIQPVLDRHCVRCHCPAKRSGGVLLTGDRGPVLSHSYFTLSAHRQVADGRNLARSNYPPRTLGDIASPLMAKLTGEHHGVHASPGEERLVRYWINTGATWPGTYAALGTGMIGGYAQNQIDRQDLKWPEMQAAGKVLQTRCMRCHADPQRPLPNSPSDDLDMPPWALRYDSPKLRFSRHILYNLSHPEQSVLLLAPLARQAGGYGMGEVDGVFASTADPDYQTLLRSIQRTQQQLDTIKRFDMPDFAPRPEYLREMRRYGLLTNDETPVGPAIYALERRYWNSFSP